MMAYVGEKVPYVRKKETVLLGVPFLWSQRPLHKTKKRLFFLPCYDTEKWTHGQVL